MYLFVWGFSSYSRIFYSFGNVTIISEGLHILTSIYSALMAIKQLGFFNVPHLLWHGPIFNNGHFRGPLTLTPVPIKRLAVELSLLTYSVCLSKPGIEPRSPACEANTLLNSILLTRSIQLPYKKTLQMGGFGEQPAYSALSTDWRIGSFDADFNCIKICNTTESWRILQYIKLIWIYQPRNGWSRAEYLWHIVLYWYFVHIHHFHELFF